MLPSLLPPPPLLFPLHLSTSPLSRWPCPSIRSPLLLALPSLGAWDSCQSASVFCRLPFPSFSSSLPLPPLFLPSRRVSSVFLASVFFFFAPVASVSGARWKACSLWEGARPDRAGRIDRNIYGVDTEVSVGIGSILARSHRYFCCDFPSRRLENDSQLPHSFSPSLFKGPVCQI